MDFKKISDFMTAGGQSVAPDDQPVVYKEAIPFIIRMKEELQETLKADFDEDLAELLDGFIDTAYVAFTGALHLAGERRTREAWEAVCDANTAKIDGRYGPIVRNEETGKILKPEGWQAPDIESIIQS